MAANDIARESRSSIELTRNAKGEYQWVIKRYYDDADEGAAQNALDAIKSVDGQLRGDFLPEKS